MAQRLFLNVFFNVVWFLIYNRHWELHEPTVEQRPGEEHSYNVKMCATYDWQDAFRIASAQGVVQCQPEKREISVLNYIYDVSSDL